MELNAGPSRGTTGVVMCIMLLVDIVTIYGRGFGFILIILLLVGFYIQKSYVRFSYTFDRLDFWYWHISFVVIIQYDFWATKESCHE